MSATLAMGSALLVGPTFGLFQEYRAKLELQKFGVWKKAVVIEHEYRNSKHVSGWMVKCQYIVDHKVYQTYNHDDTQNQFVLGDTINVIYSKSFPKIYSLDHEWKK